MTRLNLEDALKVWQQQTPLENARHLRCRELEGLTDCGDDDEAFAHLALCTWCRQRLWRLQEPRFDYVELLAAEKGLPQETTWTTTNGRYGLEIRRLIDRNYGAVLIVRVKSTLDLEGRILVVEDAQGRELLRGVVDSDGLVAAEIEDIRVISLQELVVREG